LFLESDRRSETPDHVRRKTDPPSCRQWGIIAVQLHVFQHVPFEGLGSIQTWADQAELETRITRLFRSEPFPLRSEVTHLIVMGGPMGVHDHTSFPWLAEEKRFMRDIIDAGKSVLGICLGAQLIANALGARVYRNPTPEIGWFPIRKSKEAQSDKIAGFLPSSLEVLHWHGDTFDLPTGARCLAHSDACRHQGFFLDGRVIALQFHLETTPASLEALIENCSAELVESPFIQSADAMRAVGDRFAPNQQIMSALLSQWRAT
jgi:GMP synthase-like glutamine amidotransferase